MSDEVANLDAMPAYMGKCEYWIHIVTPQIRLPEGRYTSWENMTHSMPRGLHYRSKVLPLGVVKWSNKVKQPSAKAAFTRL